MLVSFSNPKGTPVLTCTRDDGTSTYSKSRHGAFFGPHDLMHYAVETTLGLKESFFGLVAQGRSIGSFNEPGAVATLPAEAVHTEHIVNQLHQEQTFGTPTNAEEFNRTLLASVAGAKSKGLPPPRMLSEDELRLIRERFAQLLHQYRSLGPEGRIKLEFPG